jgi:gluconolactonase
MKIFWSVFIGVTLTLSLGGEAGERASVIADGAHLQKLAGGFSFTEGPAADAAGNLFFTDQPNNRIMKWSTDGTLSVFLSPCGRANGLYFDRAGYLWACADEHNELWRIDPNGSVTVVIKNYKGKLLNGPNDLWIARFGGIYLSDPFFQRSYWTRGGMEQGGQYVFYLAPDLQTLTPVVTDLQQPNGIIGTPDGRFLYVGDYGGGKTYRYRIQPDGTLGEKTLFCSQGSDGMTIDQEGDVYFTGLPSPGTFVNVYNRSGQKIETISVPEVTANVTFGGVDGKTLFITARTSLYALRMRVQGASVLPDFNGDERVDLQDYACLARSWKLDDPNVDLGPTTLGDGVIDLRDLALLAEHWLGEVLPVGLKAYWKLDEPNDAVAYDSAGTFDAAVIGDTLWQSEGGRIGGALQLDGIDDYIKTPYVLDPAAGAFSVFAWVKGGRPGQVILSQKGSADWLSTDPAEGKLLTNVAPTPGRSPIPPLVTDVVVTDGDWHRVGLVWNGSERILYVDGLETARDMMPAKLKSSGEGLYIGVGKGLEPGSFWSGSIDDVRLYDRTIVP